MMKRMTRNNVVTFVFVGVIVLSVLGATYAFINLNAENSTAQGVGGCFEVDYVGTSISNSNLVSGTSYSSGAKASVKLAKKATCEIYTKADIVIETDKSTTANIASGALKYVVMNGSNQVSSGAITSIGQTKLATVTLGTSPVDYSVYIWVDANVSNGSFNGKTYLGEIYAEAVQSSTIQ